MRSIRPRVIVFDVDGTLYCQTLLRTLMAREMFRECVRRPSALAELWIIREFRRERERLARERLHGIRSLQYDAVGDRLSISPDRVRHVVDNWIRTRPLSLLRKCRYAGAGELFGTLRQKRVGIAVLSDYVCDLKLKALDLAADVMVSSEDKDVDSLKPEPIGLRKVLRMFGVAPSDCLYVGDREDHDGECARALGVPFILRSSRDGPRSISSYQTLAKELDAGILESRLNVGV